MSKLDVVNQSQTPEFQAVVGQHFLEAAIAVMNEDHQTANHLERVAFAKTVIAGGLNRSQAALIVATNATVAQYLGAGLTVWSGQDNDISYVVASVWNALAGVST